MLNKYQLLQTICLQKHGWTEFQRNVESWPPQTDIGQDPGKLTDEVQEFINIICNRNKSINMYKEQIQNG